MYNLMLNMGSELEPPIFGHIRQWIVAQQKPIYFIKDINGALGLRGLPNGRALEANRQAAQMNGVELSPWKSKISMEAGVFERVCQSAAIIRGIQSVGEMSFQQFVTEVDCFLETKDEFSIKDIIRLSGRKGLSITQRERVREVITAAPGEITHPPYFSKILFRVICLELGPVRSSLSPQERSQAKIVERNLRQEAAKLSIDDYEYFVLGLGFRALHNRRELPNIGIGNLTPVEMGIVNRAAEGFIKVTREQGIDVDRQIKECLSSFFGKLPILFAFPQEALQGNDPNKIALLQILLKAQQQAKSPEDVSAALKRALII